MSQRTLAVTVLLASGVTSAERQDIVWACWGSTNSVASVPALLKHQREFEDRLLHVDGQRRAADPFERQGIGRDCDEVEHRTEEAMAPSASRLGAVLLQKAFQRHLLTELRDTGYEPAFALLDLHQRPLVATVAFASPPDPQRQLLVALADRCFAAAYFRYLQLA